MGAKIHSRRAFIGGVIAATVGSSTAAFAIPFPAVVFPSIRGGPDAPALYRGDLVFVNAWASWCPPCREEIPAFARLAQTFASHGLSVIGIDQGETFDTVASFVAELAIPYPVLIDRRQVLSELLGIRELPFTIIVDRRGMIAKTIVGAMSYAKMESEANRSGLDQRIGS